MDVRYDHTQLCTCAGAAISNRCAYSHDPSPTLCMGCMIMLSFVRVQEQRFILGVPIAMIPVPHCGCEVYDHATCAGELEEGDRRAP